MDEIERYLSTNKDGARVRIQKALKLKQPGRFQRVRIQKRDVCRNYASWVDSTYLRAPWR
jgi:hypothetical protein